MHYPLRNTPAGFTLLELMVTLAIFAILAGIAAPSFMNLIQNARLDAAAADLSDSMRYARSLSIERNTAMTVQPVTAGASFALGWGVYDDVPALLRQYDPLDMGLTCTGTPTAACDTGVVFSARGTAQPAVFTVCDNRGIGRQVTVLLSGSVRVVRLDNC